MQFAALVPVEQVLQAVVVLRNENGDARPSTSGRAASPCEILGRREQSVRRIPLSQIKARRIKFDPCKKEVRFLVAVLIVEQDVPLWRKMKSAIEATMPLRRA